MVLHGGRAMNELALFAGGGGGVLGGALLGWNTVGAVEIEPSARGMLLARQRDGVLPHFPIWDDVCSFDGRPWRGLVDVISGGFPCQDISCAGKGEGIGGARSGLWAEMHRIICEVRPRYAFMENSPMLTSRGLGRVLGDLAESGYDAAWCVLGAADVGAPHRRNRIWILARKSGRDVAHADGSGRNEEHYEAGESGEALGAPSEQQSGRTGGCADAVPYTDVPGCEEQWRGEPDEAQHATTECGGWWSAEPNVGRVADGVAARVDRLKALGNGQVPLVAACAFKFLERVLMSEGRD